MTSRYIVLLGAANVEGAPSIGQALLQRMGLHSCIPVGKASVFVSTETPTLLIPDRGVAIGHLFSSDGQPVTSEQMAAQATGSEDLEKYFLERYWGEYILILASKDSPHELSILRDPSGGTPCVYSINNGAGFVTSHISIAASMNLCSKQIDWDYISHALAFTYLRTSRTALWGVSELLPGCAMDVRGSAVAIRTCWSPWRFVDGESRQNTIDEAASRIRRAVTCAVEAWAVLDREILLELSGGLDSSIVAACLCGVDVRVVCCTVMAPVPGTDERHYARQMADLLSVDLQSVHISFDSIRFDFPPPPDSVVPAMGILHYATDEAMAAAADAHEVRSFFSGAGGDSVFCYLRGATPAADAFRERGFTAGIAAIENLSALHRCTFSKAAWLTLRKLLKGPKPPRKANRSFLNPSNSLATLEMHPWFDAPPGALPGDQEKICDLVGSQSYADGMARNTKRPMRFPLLSQPVVEACLGVPSWMWISGGRNRSVARSAFSHVLPPAILHRRSKGTYVNYCGAIFARTRMQMFNFLASGHLNSRGLLDLDALAKFLATDLPPRDLSFFRVFELCMIENWIRHQTPTN